MTKGHSLGLDRISLVFHKLIKTEGVSQEQYILLYGQRWEAKSFLSKDYGILKAPTAVSADRDTHAELLAMHCGVQKLVPIVLLQTSDILRRPTFLSSVVWRSQT